MTLELLCEVLMTHLNLYGKKKKENVAVRAISVLKAVANGFIISILVF